MIHLRLHSILSPLVFVLAACGVEPATDRQASAAEPESASTATPVMGHASDVFDVAPHGDFDEPWAMAFVPGTNVLMITQKAGTIAGYDTETGRKITVSGAPKVDYGGQGGLGDIAFLPGEEAADLNPRTIYLSWAEAGEKDTRGAAVGKGRLVCAEQGSCAIRDLQVIWRQFPKVTGRGHYSHRLTFSPDGKYLFVASGERQKQEPAQDISNTLGTIVRLNPDGSAADGNPLAGRDTPSHEVWSYGHRNILGLRFDPQGQLWDVEHGPAGGDELNLVEPGKNYGWPVASDGDHYNGTPIPNHSERPQFAAPAVSWTPVIAPGDLLFYTGSLFPDWRGQALIPGLKSKALVRVSVNGAKAMELARYGFGERLRAITQGPDGAIWVVEDGKGANLLKLTPR
ncbi:dehydrogenase [Croceicoccus estronivorus]|uniref:PQQ-dependent sugar dehydrogenase n=1 Tax=Croceicoccus estronivorus TaxID=1172626 RepID=UPI00082A99D5|nr:PQQ-dependent sugar dehydrogenase [Croceicoccus estronivorus]OCC22820.1 dehydrogenase [Croceicoccus estronivorus]